MRISLLSDLHLELNDYQPPPDLAPDVVILAGDIHTLARGVAWARETFQCSVLYVPGNHEYYRGHLDRTLAKMREHADAQVRVLDCDEVVLVGVRFLCATAWVDYCSTNDPARSRNEAFARLNDFKRIRHRAYHKVTPEDLALRSQAAKAWLQSKLAEPFAGHTVVVTHHAPSLQSLPAHVLNSPLAASYANAWELLLQHGVSLWLHGHSHQAVDYKIGSTRIVCNPRGYPAEQTAFNESLIVEI